MTRERYIEILEHPSSPSFTVAQLAALKTFLPIRTMISHSVRLALMGWGTKYAVER